MNTQDTNSQAPLAYKQHISQQKREIVDVKVPSGFVFKFIKPNRFSYLFSMGDFPQSATNEAVAEWKKTGLATNSAAEEEDTVKIAKKMLQARNLVLELSFEPKLVSGLATEPNELSTDNVDTEDLAYLLRWVTAGGDSTIMLSLFPGQPEQRAVDGTDGAALRKKGK